MALVIQRLRRGIHYRTQILLQQIQFQYQSQSQTSIPVTFLSPLRPQSTIASQTTSSYVSDMRKSVVDGNMLRLLRNEIQYELDRSPLSKPAAEFNGFKVDECPGEQWIRLQKQFSEKEEVKVEVTMFDGSVPIPGIGEKKGVLGQEVQLHITLIVSIFKEESDQILEFIGSAWPDSVEIDKVYVRERAKMPNQPYTGPMFRELDDELQESLYEFLEERGVDDSLCVFLHKYINYKEKSEYLRWMTSVRSLVEKKGE